MKTLDPCPGAELIAACVEGRLQGEARTRILQHLLGCEDCYTVFSETARFVDVGAIPVRKRARLPYVAAAAAVLIIGLVASIGGRWWLERRAASPAGLMNSLTDAIGTARPAEGRLSIPLPYGPPGAFTRSGDGSRPLGARALDVTAVAGRIEELAAKDPSPEALHALGLAHLALGDLDEAVAALDRALIPASHDPQVLSDLAAALLERGVRQDRPQDTARALSVVQEALEIEPSLPEARFNRALTLESLHLRQRALEAWKSYLEVDSRSAWADEARRRIEVLSRPTETQLWPSFQDRLGAAALAGNETAVREIVDRYRQASREWLRDQWLGRWGGEVQSGNPDGAARTLRAAALVARVHSELTGDPMCRDMVAVLVDAARSTASESSRLRELAAAHVALTDAYREFDANHPVIAAPRFKAALEGLQKAGSPARLWAAQGLSASDYYNDDYNAALRRLEALRSEAEPLAYLSLQARVHWLLGLNHGVESHLSKALSEYRQAYDTFEKVGDTGNLAFLSMLITEDLRFLADRSEEWQQRQKALKGLDRYVPAMRAETILMEAAMACLEEGLPRTALEFQEECLASCRPRRDPVQTANALQWRALAHYQLGRMAEALDDLQEGRSWAARIEDASLHKRLESELHYAAGLVSTLGDPITAQAELTKALDYFRSAGSDLRVSELCLARGRVALQRNDNQAAADDFLTGIQVFEQQRLSVVPAQDRISFFDTATELFDEGIGVEVRRGRIREALTLAERARARQLLETLSSSSPAPADAEQIAAGLPEGTALILYEALPERLLAWVVSSGNVDLVSTPVDMREPERLLSEIRQSAADPSKLQQIRDDLIRLDRIVWRPVAPRLTRVPTLVFVPDKALHLLPFAALLDETTNQYMIQNHEVVVSPSATIYLRALERQQKLPQSAAPSALAVGDPAFDRTTYPYLSRLERAANEADRIAGLYASSLVLRKEAATKAAFLDAAGRFSIVHYAGHALSHDIDPLRSRLLLAPDPLHGSDGTLFAEELYGRHFPQTRLVVLAACSTAAGWVSHGEGAMSLARPFLAAGVPSVIASLWDIEDRAGSELSIRLHRRLARGAAPQEALREAQLEMIASTDPSLSSPGAWATFEMIGGSSPSETRTTGREGT